MVIKTITDFDKIQHLAPLKEGEEGCLVLDLDHTCVKPIHELFSDLLHFLLYFTNPLFGNPKRAHLDWYSNALKGRYLENIPHQANDQNVQTVIDLFRRSGWQVLILTNRSEAAANLTARHIIQAGLSIDPNECHFRPDEELLGKGRRLEKLLSPTITKVIFVDDDPQNCTDVLKTLAKIDRVEKHVFQYQPPLLPEEEGPFQQLLDRLIVQLHGYRCGKLPVEDIYTEERLREADQGLGIVRDPNDSLAVRGSFLKACEMTAQADGYPFDISTEIPQQASSKRPKIAERE